MELLRTGALTLETVDDAVAIVEWGDTRTYSHGTRKGRVYVNTPHQALAVAQHLIQWARLQMPDGSSTEEIL